MNTFTNGLLIIPIELHTILIPHSEYSTVYCCTETEYNRENNNGGYV